MANVNYFDFMDAVAGYYGSGSDEWLKIAQMGVTPETLPLIQEIPGVSVTLSNSGNVLGYDLSTPFESPSNPIAVVDSNIQTGAYSSGAFNASIPGTAYTDQQTQETVFQSGVKTTAGGLTVAAVVDKLNLARIGVSLGTKLGKEIDSRIYNIDPEWWDDHFPSINPETWDTMATTEGGKNLIRSIFGLKNDDTKMYVDERLLAYTYMTLLKNGAYQATSTVTNVPDNFPDVSDFIPIKIGKGVLTVNNGTTIRTETYGGNVVCGVRWTSTSKFFHRIWFSDIAGQTVNDSFDWISYNIGTGVTTSGHTEGAPVRLNKTYTFNNKTVYWNAVVYSGGQREGATFDGNEWTNDPTDEQKKCIAWLAQYNAIPDSITGISQNPNASIQVNPNSVINPSTNLPVTPQDNLNDVLQALKNTYPDLFNDSVYEDIVQPDGTTDRITYTPTPFPDLDIDGNPITNMNPNIDPQTNPEINPENRTSPYLQTFVDTVTTNPVTPDTGGGEASPIVTPTGAGSSLWAIYNPTQSELNSFGAWLWSSSFVEQIKKLFNDPMQAIIGVHKVFATPSTGASANIKCGYIDSEISAKTVTSQYSSVNCGSVNLNEYFGNVFDYDPYTKVEMFLPFIGIVPLDLDYVMRSQINVKYTVDVLSGACIANIKVTRDGYGSVLFTYGGSAVVTYPISSGSYMGMISGALSLIAGVAGTVASGGVLAPAMIGAVSGIGRMKTEVQHSGQFSGACGAMGGKKPYLIISRPQIRMADNVNQFEGIPSNTNVQLSACTGYTKVKEVHLSIPGAYDSELQEIEQLLKDGVII